MSGRPPGDGRIPELPPGWTDLQASTPGGFIYVALWREFGEVTPLELNCALMAPLGSRPGLIGLEVPRTKALAGQAIAAVGALREARQGRLDLSSEQWQRLVRRTWPHLTNAQRLDAEEILAELALTNPEPGRRGRLPADLARSAPNRRKPGPEFIVDRDQVEMMRTELHAAGKPFGHEAIARALAVSVSTVRRRLSGH